MQWKNICSRAQINLSHWFWSWNSWKRVKNLVKKVIFSFHSKITFFTRFFTRFHLFQLQNQREKLICALRQKKPLHFPIYPIENSYFLFSKLVLTFSFRIKWGCMVKKIQGNAKKKLNYVFMHHINYLYSPENKVKK